MIRLLESHDTTVAGNATVCASLALAAVSVTDSRASVTGSVVPVGLRVGERSARRARLAPGLFPGLMEPPREDDVTGLLAAWRAGDDAALEQLTSLVYSEIRQLARHHLRGERAAATMQPTALAHEAFMRLMGARQIDWQDRGHFFAVASRMIRRVLVEAARKRNAAKRGAGALKVTLDAGHEPVAAAADVDVLALHAALERLEEMDPRQVQVIELRYFAGLSAQEAAAALGVSEATVRRDWRVGKLWLRRALQDGKTI